MSNRESGGNLAEFFRNEREKLVRFVRSLIEDAADRDGEDIVQDVMLNVFNAADINAPIANLSAYIYRSLRNRIIDILDQRKGEVSLDRASGDDEGFSLKSVLSDTRYEAAAEMEKLRIREALFDALDALGEDARQIVIMTELEGRTFREISDELDIPIGTLLARKSRAIKKVRERLAGLI